MTRSGSSFVAQLLADNVIKGAPVPRAGFHRTSEAVTSDVAFPTRVFDPDGVRIDEAGGGFGTVVEISAKHCLRVFQASLDPPRDVPLPSSALSALLNGPHDPFISTILSGLHATSLGVVGAFISEFKPVSLEFREEHQAVFTYHAVVELRSIVAQGSGGDTFPIHSSSAQIGLKDRPALFAGGQLGVLRVQVACPYTYVTDAFTRRVDVYAVLSQARLTVLNDADDMTVLAASHVFGVGWSIIKDALLRRSTVHLTPTIAMVGRANSSAEPVEFDRFDVAAFHVTASAKTLQAMVIAVNMKPGCQGVIEDVVHFIGLSDFGVITDEFRTEKLFKYRWRTGGFFRRFPLSQSIQVQRGSNVENATLSGHLDLTSLDVVAFEIEANGSQDVVKLGGNADVSTDYIQLNDGTRLYSPDAHQVDFGDPKTMPWIFNAQVELTPPLPPEPLLRQFQDQAYRDAFQYIARPFAHVSQGDVAIEYTRTQAVSKQIFMLGALNSAFV